MHLFRRRVGYMQKKPMKKKVLSVTRSVRCSVRILDHWRDFVLRPVRQGMRRHMRHSTVSGLLFQQHEEETIRRWTEVVDETAPIHDPPAPGLRCVIDCIMEFFNAHASILYKIARCSFASAARRFNCFRMYYVHVHVYSGIINYFP